MLNVIKSAYLNLSRREQKSALEALIFASEEPVSLNFLYRVLIIGESGSKDKNGISTENVLQDTFESQPIIGKEIEQKFEIDIDYFSGLIEEINLELIETHRPFQIINIAGGYQFATRPEYGELLHRLVKSRQKRRFSQAALETLAVIAYRQPVTKPEIEQIRGVNSADVINSLVEKNLVEILGRKDTLGKPLLYGTTNEFLRAFGLKSYEELPKLREFEEILEDDNTNDLPIEIDFDNQ